MLERTKGIARTMLRWAGKHPALLGPLRPFGLRGLFPEPVWTRLPVDFEFAVDLPDGARMRYRSHAGDTIGRALFWRGILSYEPETMRTFLSLAKSARTVLDIGANTGLYTLLACAANPRCRVFAFEPVPRVCRALTRNICINGFAERCTAEMSAVGEREGSARLFMPFSSLNPEYFCAADADSMLVKLLSIDGYLGRSVPVDLVKIDVEAFEDKVLQGMIGTVERCRPNIIVECLPGGPYKEVERILRRFNYSFYYLHSSGPIRRLHIGPVPGTRFPNCLCVAR